MTKIAISNLAWQEHEDDEVFELMTKTGIPYLEISPFRESDNPDLLNNKSALAIKNKLLPYGIKITSLQSILYRFPDLVLFADESVRKKTLRQLHKIIDFAYALGAKTLVFGSPKNKLKGNLKYNQAFTIAIQFFKQLTKRLSETNITLCIEPTPEIYGADFVRNTKEAISLIKAIDNNSIKLNMDIGASKTNNENIEKTILMNAPDIGHIHISEPSLKTINPNSSFHSKIAKTIQEISYNKTISIEMLPANSNNIQTIKQTLSFIKNIYN